MKETGDMVAQRIPKIMCQTTLMADATADVPPAQQGAATAVLMTSQAIGGPLGPAVALSVIGLAGPMAGLAAFRSAYLVLAALALTALVISALTLRAADAPREAVGRPVV